MSTGTNTENTVMEMNAAMKDHMTPDARDPAHLADAVGF